MQSILNVTMGISRNEFKCIYLKHKNFFKDILLPFRYAPKNLNILKRSLNPIAEVLLKLSTPKNVVT